MSTPSNLTASKGDHHAHVQVSWDTSEGATGYKVYRDDVEIADVPSPSTSWEDEGASGELPTAPEGLVASDGIETAHVSLTWSAATAAPGPSHTYTVAAYNSEEMSQPSDSDTGHRASSPVLGYEISWDDGETWTSAGLTTAYDDDSAPAATLNAGTATASEGTSVSLVALLLEGASSTVGASRAYRVRANNAVGFGPPSASDTGHRGVGALEYQWQRTSGEEDIDADYADLNGLTTAQADDQSSPTSGAGRWYRCVVSAPGAEPTPSASAYGHRIPLPGRLADGWTSDGPVYAVAESSGVGYFGGTFTRVTRATGSFAFVDDGGAPLPPWPKVDGGGVNVIVTDDAGNWYLGGSFTSVGGVARRYLARVLPDGSLDESFSPEPNGAVLSLAHGDGRLYLGGSFSRVSGAARRSLAAIDLVSGELMDWNPQPNRAVESLLLYGEELFVGGGFSNISGQSVKYLAVFETAGEHALLSADLGLNNGVLTLAAANNTLYVGGNFTEVGTEPRPYLASFETTDLSLSAWNPSPNRRVGELLVQESTLYVAGGFSSIAGESRPWCASFALADHSLQAFNPQPGGPVYALFAGSGELYIGGKFSTIAGEARGNAASFSLEDHTLTSWDPYFYGEVYAIAAAGDVEAVGGDFSGLGGESRGGLIGIDLSDGSLLDWDPQPAGAVEAMSVHDNQTLYVGGNFVEISGVARLRLAAFELDAHGLSAWDPSADGYVRSLDATGASIVVGGDFTTVGGVARERLAAIAHDGALDDWNPGANGRVFVVHRGAAGDIYVGGQFDEIGGAVRENFARFDAGSPASPTESDPGFDRQVRALLEKDGVLYVGGTFNTAGGEARSRLASFDLPDLSLTSWTPAGNGNVLDLAASANVLFAARPRRLDGYDLSDGSVPSRWALPGITGAVHSVTVSGEKLLVGGGFTTMLHHQQQGIATIIP